jgi:teichuronic acid biosynthesis glycosyltransferase TuaG
MQLVTIIMPYYKKIEHVGNAINSITQQTYQNYELLIVYDDPNENDLSKLKEIISNNKKIKIIKNTKNLGAGFSRNIAIKNANGEILSFIDADDEWSNDKLEKQLNFLNKFNYDFIFCSYIKKNKSKIKNIIYQYEFIDYKKLLYSCDIGLSTVMIKKEIINDNLFPNLKTQEDYVAWLRITKDNYKAYNLKDILVTWNQVNNSLSSNFFQKLIDGFNVYKIYLNFSLFKSFYHLLILATNSLKRKF